MVERFPNIEVPKQYWDLWRTVLQSIKLSQTIVTRQIGTLKHKDSAKWLITTDCRLVYCKQDAQYKVHRITHHKKHTLLYSKEPLFTTIIESFDHLRYITPTIKDNFIIVQETKKLFKTPHKFIPTIKYIAELSIPSLLNTASSTIKETLTKPRVLAPSYTELFYDFKKYQLYRAWWEFNRTQIKPVPTIKHPDLLSINQPSSCDAEFMNHIDQLLSPLKRNVSRIQQITNIPRMIQALEEGRLLAVSNASVSADGLASHAYTIVSKDKVDRIQGSAPVDCDEDDIESTRAEKSGILAALTIINVLATMSSTTTNPIPIYCDNLDAATKKTKPS